MRLLFLFVLVFTWNVPWNVQGQESTPAQGSQTRRFIGKKTGVDISQARPEDITPENYPYTVKRFEFSNASLQDVIKTMSVDMGINLIMDPALGGKQKINMISYEPITVAEYYQAFLSVLALHGLTVLRSGPFLKVVQKDVALRSNVKVYKGDKKLQTDQFLTNIIKLKHIDAESLERKMKPFIDDKAVKSLIFYPPSNTVIISDYGSNVNKVRQIIKSLDIPSQDSIFEVLPIKYAQAKALVDIINKLLLPKSRSYSRYRAGKNKTGSQKGQAVDISALSHDERTNSIIVMGNKAGVEQVKEVIGRLDQPMKSGQFGGIYVYKVKHGKAEELADTLNELMGRGGGGGGKSSKKGKAPVMVHKNISPYGRGVNPRGVGTALDFEDIRIIAEKNTNSLLIVANKSNYDNILEILEKVDISRNQVFVKSIIMEMSTDRENDWQMANYFFPKEGGGLSRMGYGLKGFTDITSIGGATLFFPMSLFFGKSLAQAQSERSNIKNLLSMNRLPGLPEKVEVPTLSSFVKFLQTNVGANILSTPQVMALDHQQATVSIVEKIPQASSTTTSINNPAFTGLNISETNVETALIITPHINPDVNSIRLEIEQKIDDVVQSTNVPEEIRKTNLAVKKRNIKTFITLKDQETAVLGGLVRESNEKTESKVPVLGDLPLIGWLFKNSNMKRKKTNLVVFITPHIVRSAKEHKNILSDKLKERMDFIRKWTGKEDPYQELTDKMLDTEKQPLLPEDPEPVDDMASLSEPEESYAPEENLETMEPQGAEWRP